jgi:hypothetical protein
MPDNKDLEDSIQTIIVDLCSVLYKYGYRHVQIGGIMRLIGVSEEHAQKHDNECIVLDDDFVSLMKKQDHTKTAESVPPGTILH